MAGFLCLPLELRQKIYRYCLDVGYVFLFDEKARNFKYVEGPNGRVTAADGEVISCEEPVTSLFRLCRQIRAETEPLFYQLNTLILPQAQKLERFFETSLHTAERRSWVKSVRLSMTLDDVSPTQRETILDTQWSMRRQRMLEPESGEDYEFDFVHNPYQQYVENVAWPNKVAFILNQLTLASLTVDLQDSRCLYHCECGMRGSALLAFGKGFAKGMPKTTRILIEDDNGGVQEAKAVELFRKWTLRRSGEATQFAQVDEADLDTLAVMFPNEE